MNLKGYLLKKGHYNAVKNFLFFFLNFRKFLQTPLLLLKQKDDLNIFLHSLKEYDTLFISHSIGGGTVQSKSVTVKPRLSVPVSTSVQQARKPNPTPATKPVFAVPSSISLMNKEPPQKRQKVPDRK